MKKLDTSTFENWLTIYFNAWEEGNPELITDTFSEDGSYNVTPFTDRLKGKAEIYKYWAEGTQQEEEIDSTTSYEIIVVKDNTGFAKWQAQFNKKKKGVCVRLDGVMEVVFNEALQVTIFNEW